MQKKSPNSFTQLSTNMNNLFSIQRFYLLIRKQWLENYLLFLGSFVVLVTFDFLMLYLSNDWNNAVYSANFDMYSTYTLSLGICTAFSVWAYARTINTQTKQIAYYTQPASILEKLAATLLFQIPAMLAMFAAALAITLPIAHSAFDSFHHTSTNLFPNDVLDEIQTITLIFLTLQSFLLLGMHTFQQYAIVKTLLIIIILSVAFLYVLPGLTYHFILPIEGFQHGTYNTLTYMRNHEYRMLDYRPLRFSLQNYLVYICWIALYFKIKEKQL